jgi:hypothetical protein
MRTNFHDSFFKIYLKTNIYNLSYIYYEDSVIFKKILALSFTFFLLFSCLLQPFTINEILPFILFYFEDEFKKSLVSRILIRHIFDSNKINLQIISEITLEK